MIILTVGGFVIAAVVVATLFPSIVRTGNTIATERGSVSAQTLESIAVVNAYSELDGTGGWQDTDADGYFDVLVWVKNTGDVTVRQIDGLDVFVQDGGTSERIPHAGDAGGTYPQWTAAVEGGGSWVSEATLAVTVHYQTALAPGDYGIEVVTAAGAQSLDRFGF